MLGSSSLEGAYNDVTSAIDILGDPLSNLDLGALPGMSEKATDYQPVEDDDRVSWMNYDYTFGWSKEFSKDMEISLSDTVQGDEQMNSIMKDLQSGNAVGADAVGGGFEASASFNFSITPSMGFRLRVSLRDLYDESGKRLDSRSGNFFEDLVFYFKVKWGVASTISIATPVGINILIDLGADGDIAGVYHMYMDYADDDYHDEYKLPFDSENFGIFKKFSNDRVRREGYLFANPAVTIGVGAEYCGISVTCDAHFNFDADFRFTAKGVDAYGDLTYNLTWSFKAFGFTLYSLTLPDGLNKRNIDTKFNTIPIFHTSGINGHINFDYEVEPTLKAALSGALDGVPAQSLKDSRPTSRAYLDNRSDWRQPDESVTLLDAQGSTESELRSGAAEDLKIQLTPIGKNGDLLMVFVDDVPERTSVNKRAVYYSIYTASDKKWSEPAVIHDDGTADDYPSAQDLGDGRIFVAWSSVETPMGDGATLEKTLQATNIQAAFFDTASRKFGPVANLTRTTDADRAADLMPRAAYAPDTKRLILYYTKTEYDHLDDPSDMGDAFSLIAYLFYENGVWSNTGDAYTEEELSYFENPEEYKKNWYGQRFLETRLDLDSDVTPRVAESAAIGYNGLALFSYVVDWDDNLTTTNDRDIFLQIYNFSEDSFSHIIRITEESGAYSLPTLVHSDNGTYLFYGDKGQAKESGCIRYLNVSYVIKNGLYEKITRGSNEYYVLRATRSAVTTDSPEGEGMSLPAETVAITADKAVDCGSLSDFDAFVSSDGRTYLLWTALNQETGASDIYASILNAEDESLNEAEDGAESQAAWSDAVLLTDGGRGAYYSNLDVIGSKDGMIIVSGKGQFMDASANSMVQINHTPYSKLALDDEIAVDNPYAAAGDNVNVTATLRNAGLDTFVPDANGVSVSFRVNGEEVERVSYDKPIPGGTSVEIPVSVEIPDAPQTVISVECDGLSAQTTLDKSYVLTLDEENSGVRYAEPDPRTNVSATLYAATLVNSGNESSPQVDFTVTAGERTLGTGSVAPLESKERGTVEIALDIPDEAWTINDDGMGALSVTVEAVSDGRTVLTEERTLSRLYDAEAVALLKAGADVKRNQSFTVAEGELKPLEPAITGADGLTVDWQYSDDGAIAGIDYSNAVYGVSVGTTTIHGMVTPKRDVIEFNKDGDAERADWSTLIPSNLQIPVTAQVTVTEAQTQPGTGYEVTFDSDGGSAVEARAANENGLISEPPTPTKSGYEFDGWHLEDGTRYDFSAPLTGDTTLKAHWKQSTSKAGCYVATSVYGSYDCPEVWTLRRFRDEVLAETWYGRLFIRRYYAVSPTAVKLFGDCEWFQSFWRGRLDKLADDLRADGFDDTPYEDTQW